MNDDEQSSHTYSLLTGSAQSKMFVFGIRLARENQGEEAGEEKGKEIPKG